MQYYIEYSAGNQMGDDAQVIEADNMEQANEYAYEEACSAYESYVGLHGIRGLDEIMEEDELEMEEADEVFNQEREDSIHYFAEEYDPEKHDDMLS